MPGTRKLRNLRRNPQVTLNLDSAAYGQDVVLAEGRAVLDADGAVAEIAGSFAGKYAAMLGGASLEQWRGTFSVPVLIVVSRIVTWTRRDGQLRYRSVP